MLNVEDTKPLPLDERWQTAWSDERAFLTPTHWPGRRDTHIHVSSPFTSGSSHLGHIRSYALADAYARFRRARGDSVLFSLGFDAFGLPAELEAIQRGVSPRDWVLDCVHEMEGMFKRMGFSFDWDRTFVSCEPDIYRWTQWLFLSLYERDLVYRRTGMILWCTRCRTVLARSQAENGSCWRCAAAVQTVRRTQWFLRSSTYHAENLERLEGLEGWSEQAVGRQRNLLGCITGIEFDAETIDGRTIAVFTPSPEQRKEGEFVLLSPNHPALDAWVTEKACIAELDALLLGPGRQREPSLAVDTLTAVRAPGVKSWLPVLVSPEVDERFGATAVLGIPAKDDWVAKIADRLPKRTVVSAGSPREGVAAIRPAMRFRAADFPISRQRAWGTPIPIIHCDTCGVVPVPFDQLPVLLPPDLEPAEHRNTLADHRDFIACTCPTCGHAARREDDTLDCHMDAAWQQVPAAVPVGDRTESMFDHEETRRWLPVALHIYGSDVGGFVLDARVIAKGLRDCGVYDFLPTGEPYVGSYMHELVLADGRKMSKHLGNGVDPSELVEQFGADVVRFAVLHAAAAFRIINWDDRKLKDAVTALTSIVEFAKPRLESRKRVHNRAEIDPSDPLHRRLTLWCSTAVRRITENYEGLDIHRVTRNLLLLLSRIEDFEQRAVKRRGALSDPDRADVDVALTLLIRLMAPIVPHTAEELWQSAGNTRLLSSEPWPTSDKFK